MLLTVIINFESCPLGCFVKSTVALLRTFASQMLILGEFPCRVLP